jgi:hypothetical protein
MHTTQSGATVCTEYCEPDCVNKEYVGEDGCGGFSGKCPSGTCCSNYTCVTGNAGGSCESPFFLDCTDNGIIDMDTRVTLVSYGDTTQGINQLIPKCNTLAASPEQIFTFTVPANRSYGYDLRSSGYDTVLQLMKEVCSSRGPVSDPDPGLHIVNWNDDSFPPGDFGS